MSESTALTLRQVTPSVWQMIETIAPAMHQCRFYGISNKEQAMAIMLKGHEIGLPPGASFEFIQIIQNKPTLSPRGALALILNSDKLAGLKISEPPEVPEGTCKVWMKRTNGIEFTVTWTLEDAKRADLITEAGTIKKDGSAREKGNWEKYPQNMLRWRAIGYCADVVFPDILGGLKRADEFGAAIDNEGNVIEGSWTNASSVSAPDTQQDAPPPTSEPTSQAEPVDLDSLVQKYGGEKIIAANEGKIPSTSEEIMKIVQKLEAYEE